MSSLILHVDELVVEGLQAELIDFFALSRLELLASNSANLLLQCSPLFEFRRVLRMRLLPNSGHELSRNDALVIDNLQVNIVLLLQELLPVAIWIHHLHLDMLQLLGKTIKLLVVGHKVVSRRLRMLHVDAAVLPGLFSDCDLLVQNI